MKVEQAKTLTENAISKLATALAQGKSEALKTYLAAMAKFHNYSIGNILLIACQYPNASHVAGFNTWKKFGRYVKKGEKGILIIAPVVRGKRDESLEDETESRMLVGFKAAYVFDVSQTEGEHLPEFACVSGDPREYIPILKTHIWQAGIEVEYSTELGAAQGVSVGGKILLRSDLPPAEEFSVLVHEYAHELLHRGVDRATYNKTVRETEAEAVAFVVCEAVGLSTNNAAADYIHLYSGSQETLAQSLDRIQQTAATIIQAITPKEKE